MKTIYSWKKRMELKEQLHIFANLIVRLKDLRKTVRPRKFPNFVPTPGVWLDVVQEEFRHHHIAASMMRGKTMEQIERLPKNPKALESRIRPSMRLVNIIMESCLDENVCVSVEEPVKISASGASGSCSG